MDFGMFTSYTFYHAYLLFIAVYLIGYEKASYLFNKAWHVCEVILSVLKNL